MWWLILQSKFQVSTEAYLGEGVRDKGAFLVVVVTEGICPISWGDLCLTGGMPVCEQLLLYKKCEFLSKLITQQVLTRSCLHEAWR